VTVSVLLYKFVSSPQCTSAEKKILLYGCSMMFVLVAASVMLMICELSTMLNRIPKKMCTLVAVSVMLTICELLRYWVKYQRYVELVCGFCDVDNLWALHRVELDTQEMVTLVAVSVMLTICELSTAFSSAQRNTIRTCPSILGFQTSILLFLKRFSYLSSKYL
jgi:hypothetical protein